MKQDLFKYLPSEIIINILWRLPVRTIASSKCVCKPWLHLLESDDFVSSHLSKSVPSLAFSISHKERFGFQVLEFESLDFPPNQVMKCDFPHEVKILGAANGLFLLKKFGNHTQVLCIFNPITREYVELRRPNEESESFRRKPPSMTYRFGLSKVSRQYKVVCINVQSECNVYTLGIGSWRHVCVEAARASLSFYKGFSCSAFVDGHLYWTVEESSPLITCFDLETECFTSLSAPASRGGVSALKGCLYFVECGDEIVVWLMKDYGAERSWSKDYVIKRPVSVSDTRYHLRACPINVFKNGDMVMILLWGDNDRFLLRYNSDKTKAIQENVDILPRWEFMYSMVFSLSFLSLKGLGVENVISF